VYNIVQSKPIGLALGYIILALQCNLLQFFSIAYTLKLKLSHY